MADPARHPDAPQHLPAFLPGADGSDPTFTNVMIFAVGFFLIFGVAYLRLHSLPERMAHRRNSVQMQAVAVLALLALITHNATFWIAALLLVVVELPDFLTPLRSIAGSLERVTQPASSAIPAAVRAPVDGAPAPGPSAPSTPAARPAPPAASRDRGDA